MTRCCRCRPRRPRASPCRRRTSSRRKRYLTDVIDPLGGSYYVETLTDQMEEKILDGDRAHRRGGRHVRGGRGGAGAAASAGTRRWPSRSGSMPARRRWWASTSTACRPRRRWQREALKPPPRKKIEAQLKRLKRFKAERSQARCAARHRCADAGGREQGSRTCTRRRWRPPPPTSRTARSAQRCARSTASASR